MKKTKEKNQLQVGIDSKGINSKIDFELEVYIEKDNSKKKIIIDSKKKTIKDILNQLKILSSASIVTINDEIATDDDVVKYSDKIKILSVISGG